MSQSEKENNRKVFLCLMGSMVFVTAGVVSLAFFKAEKKPGFEKFSFSPFFSSFEAKAALAQDMPLYGGRIYLEELKLPAVPEYEQGELVFDESVPEEDMLDGGRTVALPAVDNRLSFIQPLAVHSLQKTLSLADISRQKLEGGSVIEQLLEDEEAEFEEDAETPWVEHTVGAGERMLDISRKYGILVATIQKANNISNPDRLAQGQVLLVPRSEDLLDEVLEEQKSRAEEQLAAKQRAEKVDYKNYTVKAGDSLWTIAHANNLNYDTLVGTNHGMRNPDKLSPGTVLRVPNQDGMCIKVAKGQTLAALAKKYNVSEKAVRMANGLKDKDQPKAGEEIFLPGASQSMVAIRNSASGGGVSKKAPSASKAPSSARGSFAWPVQPNISSRYGWRVHPIRKTRLFHSGIDIRAPRNTPIRAAKDGQVIFAGWMNGYGRSVVIRHDSSYTTLYTHAQSLRVKKGDYVKKGAIVATVGTSGRSTGPHTHFEVRYNNKPVNPMNYLR